MTTTKKQAIAKVARAVAAIDMEKPVFEHVWEEVGTQVYASLRRDPGVVAAVNQDLSNEDLAHVFLAAIARGKPDFCEMLADHVKHAFAFHTDHVGPPTRRRPTRSARTRR